jgi:hypothetical protein
MILYLLKITFFNSSFHNECFDIPAKQCLNISIIKYMVNLQMFSLSPSLNVSIQLINNIFLCTLRKLPNLDPWMNQQNEEHITTNKFENYLLSIRDERQRMIYPNCHPTYNERHQKIIELIDWTLEKYKANMENTQQKNEQEVIIDNIIEELDKKRNIARNKMKKAMLKDDVSMYRLEETTLDYVLFTIREATGRLI